ncbi:hypothetical protein HHE02_15130 [Helicobacter heilmannii]|uniref:hypothetical protein n=1 Tax=Helicobacter heilmannii TaxID=35817 RepID=UPI0006A13CF7|nr:hypothetical protein [Helicobacter heilmannii]CRF48194.1 hypothetical protein HHE02_15130 [Helicobacter heilmannii]
MKTSKRPFSLALVASLSLSSFALADNTNNSQAAMIVNSLSGLLGSNYTINSSGYGYQNQDQDYNMPAPIYQSISATTPLTFSNGPIGKSNTPLDPNLSSCQNLIGYNLFSLESDGFGGLFGGGGGAIHFSTSNLYDPSTLSQLTSRFARGQASTIENIIQGYQARLNFDGGGGETRYA